MPLTDEQVAALVDDFETAISTITVAIRDGFAAVVTAIRDSNRYNDSDITK